MHKRRLAVMLGLVAALLAGASLYLTSLVSSQSTASSGTVLRPSGIPANVSTQLANLMQVSPVYSTPAPGFSLTDQRGRSVKLSQLRGKVVVLEFMDPHCTDICPIVSQEFVDAYHDLGSLGSKVVFAAINVNSYHTTVHDVAKFSAAHGLTAIPDWHFLTGQIRALRAAWNAYHIVVRAASPNADVIHTSAIYFIDRSGKERFVATPMVDHAKGAAYLPLSQITSWGHGIAVLASDLAH